MSVVARAYGPVRRPSSDRVGEAAVLALPVFLMHARAVADIDVTLVAVLFLLRSWRTSDWAWARSPWFRIACAWWAWLVVCSLPVAALHRIAFHRVAAPGAIHGGRFEGLAQALAAGRFLLFAAGLETWILRPPRTRRRLWIMLAAGVAYIALQSLLQFATGENLYGQPRFSDGSLTGPYAHPRAAAPLSRLLFPVLLPMVAALLGPAAGRRRAGGTGRMGRTGRTLRALAAFALAATALALMVLMGQRMPLLLCGLGVVVVGLVIRRLRPGVVALLVAMPLLVGAAAIVSPPSFHHLWTVFSRQMEHLPSSPYGLIAARAAAMVEADPVTGLGADGYRRDCANPRYFHDFYGGNGRGAWDGVCVQHPHNHYLQAAVEGGLPGLALFCAMVVAWILAVSRGIFRRVAVEETVWRGIPLQAGLLAAVAMQEWPIASASAFTNMPLGGWFFLLLGFGLALGRDHMAPAAARADGER